MTFFKTALIAIGLNCCLSGADFLPLREGNSWTYREPVSGQTFSVRVGPSTTTGGNSYFKLTGYLDTELLVRAEEVFGSLMYWNEARKQEFLLTSFEPFEGGYWLAPGRACPEQDGQTQNKRGTHDGPAGPVAGVLEIHYRAVGCADIGPVQEQYAEHLGMLRRVQTSIAGSRTFDLVSARVGNLTIDAAPAGKFSVSVAPPSAANPVSSAATFHLQVSSPLTLSFPSGQEYDFVLYDSAGTPRWTWSSSATFIQAQHQRTVTDDWSATVEIPWPATPGDYTVQATVTTAGSPRFAATAPITIAPQQ
uniref:Intracellular proteinase inhibitor BsuPI domain-containing protein n=1 Tax=Solibacter usitatus (strain Ellin6076) TaxID=234267 RepID=Q027M5_SOLUE